jgi:hypothetical protein
MYKEAQERFDSVMKESNEKEAILEEMANERQRIQMELTDKVFNF